MLLIGCMGCHSEQGTKPADLIAEKQMVDIWVDMHVADAVVDQQHGADHPNRALTAALYNRIYEIHHINALQYKSSYKYYESQPAIMDKLYDQVLAELSKKQAVISKK